ncbi:Triosephosphate isomerase [Candidatus Moranella endobia PCVAL]|uniref:Triosephosphate isomerase n=1 Tax=Moranella endobia (strain PCIT) TaxID=903503 RepID=F7XXU3_MOREP|nr:triose-phosphate isomerase [Candidatus Moranella endobia]AEI74919.1 triosephosphate isomerase [Candidatus Moranella endobia PCIT]AGJ61166.1 Triosephosphate isomerase [Candidatus Moranella endobia PCVAL]
MRHPLVIGNWKLNGSTEMVKELIVALCNKLSNVIGCDVVIAPPVVYLDLAKHHLGISNSNLTLGAQNVDTNIAGAFTGEVSASMLKDIGAKYIIIGHSERRTYHKESDDNIVKKFTVLKLTGLIPILCIGESEAENQDGKTESVCARQLDAVINHLGVQALENCVIAYEPIWAIGTGKSAKPTQVQAVHKFIRGYIAKHNVEIAENIIILYGGSVNPSNATELFTQLDIDGALVGGASLMADTFVLIVKAAAQAKQNLRSAALT